MRNNIIAPSPQIVKVRPNLYQVDGAVIGYGALLAPGGLYYCFTCNSVTCEHVGAVDEAWLAGGESAEELIFASGIEWPDYDDGDFDNGLNEPTL